VPVNLLVSPYSKQARNLQLQIQILENPVSIAALSCPVSGSEPLHTVGETADLVGVSISTIRMYEREGLIIVNRRESRHRRYTEADIERIRCIRSMIRDHKVSIAGIRRLLALIPCWKIVNCPDEERAACGAFRQHEEPCWMATERSWRCKSAECRLCDVYISFADCHSLKQTIASLTPAPHDNASSSEAS
jgi:MerR family transcriptional regulator/heat shock protein HspR